jgi:hypothetical protein
LCKRNENKFEKFPLCKKKFVGKNISTIWMSAVRQAQLYNYILKKFVFKNTGSFQNFNPNPHGLKAITKLTDSG